MRHREQVELLGDVLVRAADRVVPLDLSGGLHQQRRLLDDRLVNAALERTRGNVAEAARVLGVTRAFIYANRTRRNKVRESAPCINSLHPNTNVFTE